MKTMKTWIVCLSLLAGLGLSSLRAEGNQCPKMGNAGADKPACCSEAKPLCPVCPFNTSQSAKPAVSKAAAAAKPAQCPFAKSARPVNAKPQPPKAAVQNTQTAAK